MDVAGIARANPFNLSGVFFDDVVTSIARVEESAGRIEALIAEHGTGPLDDAAKAATKDARVGAYKVNMEAQARLEPHFDGAEATVESRLHQVDARLEDANWQLAQKPSPDGRFNGIDLPGSLRDTRDAIDILGQLAPRVGDGVQDTVAAVPPPAVLA